MRLTSAVLATALVLAPVPAFAAGPVDPAPPPSPSQVRAAHLAWAQAVVTASSPVRWGELARLRAIHPALVPLPCNAGLPSSALERMAVNALRLAAVRRGDGADRTARRYVKLAGDYARDAARELPRRCVGE